MKKSFLLRPLLAVSAALFLLAGCGGGGGGGEAPASAIQPTTSLGASAQYEGICTLEGQQKFVRAYLDEVYLWYNEIPDVDPARYSTIPDYFNALLVRTPDANGLPKDRFSAVLPRAQAQDVLRQSPAVQQASADALLKAHTDAVPVTKVVTTSLGRRAGYILFNDHERGSQDDLITAFRDLQAQGIQDLVLDLRNNSGGFLYIALTAASMIAGPSSEGQVFEQLRYNDKRAIETAASTLQFSGRLQFAETQYPIGTQLPQLGLPRVFVLTTGRTCSASESIINSLRGIDVQVIRVGSATCGKPYGFRQKDNCGYSYYPIEFQGTNAKGFGDYTAGFQPMCNIAEGSAAPGAADDPLLNGALHYMDNNACPAGTATSVQSAATPIQSTTQPTRPSWAGRLLLPEQQPRR